MATTNAFELMVAQNQEIVPDKWNAELNVTALSNLTISLIGHMVATPTQFFTNFFPRTDYCIQYVLRGKGNYFTNNQLYSLKKGTLWLLPKDKYHYYTSNKDDPYEYYWFHFNGKGAERFLEKIGLSEENPVINGLHDPNIENRFHALIETAKQDSPNEHLILSALHTLFYEIENACNQLGVHTREIERDNTIEKVIAYIKENYTKNITLQDLASVALLDKTYFIRKFKEKTKLSPIQFLIQYRISKSCSLLNSPMPLNEVATRSGFQSLGNYLQRFKDFLGVTPTQYRRSIIASARKNK